MHVGQCTLLQSLSVCVSLRELHRRPITPSADVMRACLETGLQLKRVCVDLPQSWQNREEHCGDLVLLQS